MILIIGGFAQGKLHYVEQHYVQREDRQGVSVLDGTLRLASDSKITWATESAVETMPGKQTEQPAGRQNESWCKHAACTEKGRNGQKQNLSLRLYRE